MPVVKTADAPRFEIEGTEVIGLAAPSRGATQTGGARIQEHPPDASPHGRSRHGRR